MANEELKEQIQDETGRASVAINNPQMVVDSIRYTNVERAMTRDENGEKSLEDKKSALVKKYMAQVKPTKANPNGSKAIKMEGDEFGSSTYLIVNKHGYVYVDIDGRASTEVSDGIKKQSEDLMKGQKGNSALLSYSLGTYYVADAFQKTYGTGEDAYKKAGLDKTQYKVLSDKKAAIKGTGLVETPQGLKYDYKQTDQFRIEQIQNRAKKQNIM